MDYDRPRPRNKTVRLLSDAELKAIEEAALLTQIDGEVRKVNATGGAKNVKPERYELIPWDAMNAVARVYAKGAIKYDDHNWRKGIPFGDHYAALMRHAVAFWEGEELDEDGEPHMAHVVFHALALIKAPAEHPEMDNRYTTQQEKKDSD